MNIRIHNVNFSFSCAGNKRIVRRTRGFSFSLLFLSTLWLIASSSAFAQVGLSHLHPNLARGSGNDKTLERYEWDSIDLFNGNLNISIPLGIKYPLAGEFGYQFNLTYNSNLWDLDQSSGVATAMPVKTSNAGPGWDLSFGRLIPPLSNGAQTGRWVYISPDGAMHAFYSTLHHDLSENDPGELTSYTRDGSYYRLKLVGADQALVEALDGQQTLFRLIGGEWRLSQINDRFNNRLTLVIYSSPSLWMLSDNHGRMHRVYFKADPSGYYSKIIDRVELAAFNGTIATYTFNYTTASIPRPSVDNDPATSASVTLPLLANVTRPDGSKHNFTYHTAVSAADSAGRLAGMQLPTMGKVEWDYQTYKYTTGANPTSLSPLFRQSTGVATRRLVNSGGGVEGAWTYTPSLQPSGSEEREMTTVVKTPLGDKTVYYFSVNTQSATAGWNRSDYGLPFTKNQSDLTGGRYLSKQVLDCDGAGNNCQPMRSTYVRYEQDQASDPASAEVASVNRRELSNRIVYDDDVENGIARFADNDRSDFDGLGHYRQVSTNGNFGSGDVKTIRLAYDAATGSYPSTGYAMPAPATAWILNTTSQQKIIEGQSMQVVEFCYDRSNGFLKRARKWTSTSASGTASATDILTVNTPDASGQIAVEQYYGGDVQPIGAGNLCTLQVPSSDQYQIRNTYSFGVLSGTRFHTETGSAFGPKTIDQQIDRNTGLVSISRDIAGIATSYDYDALGRQTWIKPEAGHGAWKQFTYQLATPNDYAKKFVYDKTNGAGTVLTYNAEVYDSLGRVWWEQTSFPGSYPNRYTHHNAMGWVTHKSGFSTEAPKYTEYLDLDPFGRPRIARPPQGAQHDTTFAYKGTRSITTTLKIATSYNSTTGAIAEEPRATTEVYDRQSRVWKRISHVVDQFGVPRDAVTVNTYDVQDKLVSITKDGRQISGTSAYDGRGFLKTEVFTESGGRTVSYLDIDAFGLTRRTRRQINGDPVVVSVSHSFDRAGRLTKVSDYNDSSKVLKEFFYADMNEANNWKAGKLWKAVRYNDMTRFLSPYGINVVAVTETYSYGGIGGRVSEYVTELSDSSGRYEKFTHSQTYTETGEVAGIGYPKAASNSSVTINRDRTVANSYTSGYLTGISGTYNSQAESWVSSINYHTNGMVSQIIRANGVTDSFGKDPDNHLRPTSISTSGVRHHPSNVPYDMNISPYIYDGGGNMVKAGDRYFVRPNTYQEPPLSEPVTYSTDPCTVGWRDQLDLVTALNDYECRSRVFHFYTASDRLYKIENPERGEEGRTWYLYDSQGTLLTEHKTAFAFYQVWPSLWEHTRDYIYGGRGLLATDEINRNYPKQILHYHGGAGAPGIKTDGQGYRR